MSVQFLIGADPEFFLKDSRTGKFVSAYGMIPGTKYDPLPLEGGAAQVDGMALEINVNPAATYEEFSKNIDTVLSQVRDMIPIRYEFAFVPVADFGKEYIDSQPDDAKALGCDPDYNAYTGDINPKPDGGLGFRTASGHIHVGWTEGQDISHPEHIEACRMLTKQLDCSIGLASLLGDLNDRRREMYGQFGAFRPKHYGVEYRVLSNYWLIDPKWRKYIFNQTLNAAHLLVDGRNIYDKYDARPIYNTAGYTQIMDYISTFCPHTDPRDFEFIALVADKLRRVSRPIAHNHTEKFTSGEYFRNVNTLALIHYDDASYQDVVDGIIGYYSRDILGFKKRGLTWAQVVEERAKPKEKKKGVDPVLMPGQIYTWGFNGPEPVGTAADAMVMNEIPMIEDDYDPFGEDDLPQAAQG